MRNTKQQVYRIMYMGQDIQSLTLLSEHEAFHIVGVNLVPDFINHPTLNPANLLFKLIYYLQHKNRCLMMLKILIPLWKRLHVLSNSIYRRYAGYLILLIENRYPIIDTSDVEQTKHFIVRNEIDVAVVNNWWILPEEIISAPNRGAVNVHPSRLPEYRGSVPTLWSLKNHDSSSAVSYILLSAGVDNGDLIGQHEFPIEPEDDAIAVEKKIDATVRSTLIDDLLGYLKGTKVATSQQGAISKTGKYYEYMEIKWNKEKAQDIYNKIILYPYLWPLDVCYYYMGSKKVRIFNIEIVKNNLISTPGTSQVRFPYYYVHTANEPVRLKLFRDVGFLDSLRLILSPQPN